MSPLLIVILVVVGLVVVTYLFGLGAQPTPGRRRTPGILKPRSRVRRWLPIIPLLAAVACLALAFSGFRFNLQESSPTVMLVMDVSRSMNADDVVPNRLAAAESAALAFLDELPDDFQVGLTTFSDLVELRVAPTRDRRAVVQALDALETAQGTRIGDGLNVALDAIETARREGSSQAAALLLSDGNDTGSVVPPDDAAERAGELEVPVFTVVLGRSDAEPTDDDQVGQADVETLRGIALASGGETFTADTADELTARFQDIGSQLSVDLEVQPFSTPLVVAAIGLVIVAGFMLVLAPR